MADALTGAGLIAAQQSVKQRTGTFVKVEAGVWAYEATGTTEGLADDLTAVQADLPAGKDQRRPLHWPLVFPEVFADTSDPGFDALLGNPPYLGGQGLSGALGSSYLAALQTWDGRGEKGSADLAARFVLRADELLGQRGQLGFVTTKTLIEGATLRVGLLQVVGRGWTVRRGTSAHPWPSASASVSVIEVWATKAPTQALPVLDGESVPNLSADLQPYLRETGRPERLAENEDVAFQGSNVLGLGFTLTPDEADMMLKAEPQSSDVLFPYIIGADLNRRPDVSASRWVINFRSWSLERSESYTDAIERVRRLVKPKRDADRRDNYRRLWWQYAETRPGLYKAIASRAVVIVISRVGDTLTPVRTSTDKIFSEATVVFAVSDFGSLAVLSSAAHQVWVLRYTSTLETRVRYAPSDVFLTLPRPRPTELLDKLGETLDTERRELMLGRALGLTKLYNQVHDPAVTDPAIVRLRQIHADIDHAVLAAYGWDDLDPEIGHHPTKIGIRWTVSPAARFELLDRLLVENHRRAGVPTTPADS